ncbi:MAG: RtcB family protein [Planctomycetes bacterium]|nr:RtcB family protein [Planctomycetota bacterium]
MIEGMPDLRQIQPYLFEIPKTGGMLVPGRIYATPALMESQKQDESIDQVRNVAHLPGIVKYSMAMPDFHWGYGFPIGGVAAFDAEEGVIAPGGIGYDVNCGVRLVRTGLALDDVRPQLREIVHATFRAVPAGVGSEGAIPTPKGDEPRKIVTEGARWAVEHGYGVPADLDRIEDGGRYPGADPAVVSDRAFARGMRQVGTLGSGNHFLEFQVVDEVYRREIADRLGLREGGFVFSVHSGSRGFGYQVCEDSLKTMLRACEKYGIALPDRQLCCAPLRSDEAKRYVAAMACAANFAWVNRQVMTAIVRRVLARTLGLSEEALGADLVYDVCHNIAKFEEHEGVGKVCVHRKGATRAFGPGHPALAPLFRETGQPTFIPGDMGRASFLLVGKPGGMRETFGSTCHGAGRLHSRNAMKRMMRGHDLFKELEARGVLVMAHGRDSVAEEMPEAYKDAGLVVDVMERAGVSDKVARLRPVACIKG